jgi:hypothetical protein
MCFSMDWIERICIYIVLIVAAIAIVQLFLPLLMGALGGTLPPQLFQLFKILLWAAVFIVGIIICFELFRCLIGSVRLGAYHDPAHHYFDRFGMWGLRLLTRMA